MTEPLWPGRSCGAVAETCAYKCRLWGTFNYIRTGGKGYIVTEGDGLSYSYSVYDSSDPLGGWASRVILVPTDPRKTTTWFTALLSTSGVLVCALKF